MRKKRKSYTRSLILVAEAKKETGLDIVPHPDNKHKGQVVGEDGEVVFDGFYMSCVDYIVEQSKKKNHGRNLG